MRNLKKHNLQKPTSFVVKTIIKAKEVKISFATIIKIQK